MNNISFVIPAYNAEKTLSESVNSIFNENFTNGDEIIIVDDCSTDNTVKIAEELIVKYSPNIELIKNEINKGCPASRNIGIRQAKNNLIFNLDSDNILSKNSINELKKVLVNNGVDIVSFQKYYYFKDNISKVTHKWICKSGLFTLADLFSGMTNPAPGGNFLYKKDMWLKVGGYWEYGKGLHEAWGFSFKMLVNNAKFFVVPNTFYFHRYSHESLFIRENKKNNESIKLTNMFIENNLNIFNKDSIKIIKKDPDWFNHLENQPLIIENQKIGTNGKIQYSSIFEQIKYRIRKILKK